MFLTDCVIKSVWAEAWRTTEAGAPPADDDDVLLHTLAHVAG